MTSIPTFVGGFRSGTTLLINLLGLHPDIAPWFESKSVCEALRWLRVLADPQQEDFETAYCLPPQLAGFSPQAVKARMLFQLRATAARVSGQEASGKAAYEKYPLGADQVNYALSEAEDALEDWWRDVGISPTYAAVAEATGRLIRHLGAKQQAAFGRSLWINKTPEITRFAPQLRDCLGPCRMIYLVRNGLDVVASAKNLAWGSVDTLAFNWKTLLTLTREAMLEHREDYLELRYEDLQQAPVETLNKALSFCGLAPEAADMVLTYRDLVGDSVFLNYSADNRRQLSEQELETFARVAGDMQESLGYSL